MFLIIKNQQFVSKYHLNNILYKIYFFFLKTIINKLKMFCKIIQIFKLIDSLKSKFKFKNKTTKKVTSKNIYNLFLLKCCKKHTSYHIQTIYFIITTFLFDTLTSKKRYIFSIHFTQQLYQIIIPLSYLIIML